AFRIERKDQESLDGDGVIAIERLVSRVVVGQATLAEGSVRRRLVVRTWEPHGLWPLLLPVVTERGDQLLERQPAAPHELRVQSGHVEGAKSVDARRSVTIGVAWVGCPRCNVGAIVVAPKKSARSSRRNCRRPL